ncbi:MAG: type III pantothenate kinase [Marinirhabdus sp.]|nr:type III pantothenate kinase [Marinirhabdus sp.]
MNLIIDVGNTRTKLAVFGHDNALERLVVITDGNVEDELSELFNTSPDISKAIISSVGSFSESTLQFLKERVATVLALDAQTKVPFDNRYATPTTLGVDRIALVSAAAVQFPDQNVLVIDAGSCITYDFLTADNQYLGGAISPGIQMRYRALHTFTANLPLLTPTTPVPTIGNSTEASMHCGVMFGVVHEIEGHIAFYRNRYPDFTIILTGGDAHLLRDSLKNSIFANPNFLLEGLLHILQYNTQEC